MRPLRLAAFAVSLPLFLAAASARANDPAAAQSLFDEATKLTENGQWAVACPKLEESQRLDPGIGTQYRLAQCYEHVGRLASAWANYLEVADAAHVKSQTDREDVARKAATAIEPKLSRLKIEVAGEPVAGFEVKRDGGVLVGKGQWGAAVPVDAGPHPIEVSAPGKTTWKTVAQVHGEGTVVTVAIPPLADAPRDAVAQGAPREASSGGLGTQKVIAIVAGSVGILALGAGGVTGFLSMQKHDDSSNACATGVNCSADAVSARNDARSFGDIATYTFIGGGVLVAGAAVLWFTAPKSQKPVTGLNVRAVPVVGAGSAGMVVRGVW